MGTMAEHGYGEEGGKRELARVLECTLAEFNSVFTGKARVLWRRGTTAWRSMRAGDPIVFRVSIGAGWLNLRAEVKACRHYGWAEGEDDVSPVRKFVAAEGLVPLQATLGRPLPEEEIHEAVRRTLDPSEVKADGFVAIEPHFTLCSARAAKR